MFASNNLGRFDISFSMIDKEPLIVQKIMGKCIILRAECILSRSVIEYEAICNEFKSLLAGDILPKYSITVANVTSNGDCDIWFKDLA